MCEVPLGVLRGEQVRQDSCSCSDHLLVKETHSYHVQMGKEKGKESHGE